jgi:integrase
METCNSALVYKAHYKSGDEWIIRLNVVSEEDGVVSYKQRKIRTHLAATRRNKTLANTLAEEEIQKFNAVALAHPIKDFFDQWLKRKKGKVEESTYQSYEYRILAMRPYFEESGLTLEELTPADVSEFYDAIFYKKAKNSEGCYSNRTIRDILKLFRYIIKDAYILRLINENPCEGISIPQRPDDGSEKAYIGAEDICIFLECIRGHRLELMFTFILFYGLRREEACALKWDAIRDDILHIERTVVHVKTTIEKERTKTRMSRRSYPISPQISELLNSIREKQLKNKEKFGPLYQDSNHIFTWEDGRPYSPDYVSKQFSRIIHRSEDLDNSITLHTLRVSCVSLLIHDGVDVKDIQRWVGHADIKTTLQIYARTNQKQQNKVAAKMEKFLFSSSEETES